MPEFNKVTPHRLPQATTNIIDNTQHVDTSSHTDIDDAQIMAEAKLIEHSAVSDKAIYKTLRGNSDRLIQQCLNEQPPGLRLGAIRKVLASIVQQVISQNSDTGQRVRAKLMGNPELHQQLSCQAKLLDNLEAFVADYQQFLFLCPDQSDNPDNRCFGLKIFAKQKLTSIENQLYLLLEHSMNLPSTEQNADFHSVVRDIYSIITPELIHHNNAINAISPESLDGQTSIQQLASRHFDTNSVYRQPQSVTTITPEPTIPNATEQPLNTHITDRLSTAPSLAKDPIFETSTCHHSGITLAARSGGSPLYFREKANTYQGNSHIQALNAMIGAPILSTSLIEGITNVKAMQQFHTQLYDYYLSDGYTESQALQRANIMAPIIAKRELATKTGADMPIGDVINMYNQVTRSEVALQWGESLPKVENKQVIDPNLTSSRAMIDAIVNINDRLMLTYLTDDGTNKSIAFRQSEEGDWYLLDSSQQRQIQCSPREYVNSLAKDYQNQTAPLLLLNYST